MAHSEVDLVQVLAHCRDLLDASTQLNYLAVGRHRVALEARRRWEGGHEVTFGLRMTDEADDLIARSGELLDDADAWARVWADAVNLINQQRRAAAVEQRRSERGVGERFVDVLHGDDSEDLVRRWSLSRSQRPRPGTRPPVGWSRFDLQLLRRHR